jgi:hypothetical protein
MNEGQHPESGNNTASENSGDRQQQQGQHPESGNNIV